jgi:F-type H+-transporting ATPase subunit b
MVAGVEGAIGPGIHEAVIFMNVLVIAAIVYFGAGKGIIAALKSRSEGVREKLMESKTELAKVEKALNSVKAELKDFEATRSRMLADIRKDAEQLSRTILEEATLAANRLLQEAKLTAKGEAEGAASELRKALVTYALTETQQILTQNKEQQASVHSQLFEMLNNDMKGAVGHGR